MNQIAQTIFSMLIRLNQVSEFEYLKTLVECYNWATSPNRMMTERELSVCSRFARLCHRKLQYFSCWREDENGVVVVVR